VPQSALPDGAELPHLRPGSRTPMAELRSAVRTVDEITDLVGDARLVLLGEAPHGTHEFYAVRAQVTRRLIAERGFRGVAVEADWPAAARVNRFVRQASDDRNAEHALSDFVRFPRWMWRNAVMVELAGWLREHGAGAGFYGLDLYSLRESMTAVVEYLDAVDPEAAARARGRYGCFDHFDEQAYGYATATGEKESCEDDVVAQLDELRERAAELAARDGRLPRDAHFAAEQNAKLAAAAERYYRAMYRGRASSWNLRDTHMADTLDALHEHLDGAGIVVWAHNSHLGDARATSMGRDRSELNLGQLAREHHGDDVCIVGFTTHSGTVTAARDWGAPAERRIVRPSLEGSLERLLHEAGIDRGVLELRDGLLGDELLQRMIGVIYRPESERWSHYLQARAAEQFDLLVHIDQTSALEPLEPWSSTEEPAETYPSGL
jgi:erythromycin esterase-like protein